MTTDTTEDETLLAVLIPAALADWLEVWADHVGLPVDAAVLVALYGQMQRSSESKMVPPLKGPRDKTSELGYKKNQRSSSQPKAREAVAWTADTTAEEYEPLLET